MTNGDHVVHAPFNFVPFPEKILIPYSTENSRPQYNGPITDYLSGQIRITIIADTPLIVNHSHSFYDGNATYFYFSKDHEGKPFIPASTLRGLLRSNMTILGFGPAINGGSFTNITPYSRQIWDPEKEPSNFSREHYRQTLGIQTHRITDTNKCYSVPTKVLGGYLYCDKSAKAYIRPVQGQYLHISREAPIAAPWQDRYAFCQPVWYQTDGIRVTKLDTQPFPGGASGHLLSPGWKKNQKSLYLFPEPDLKADPIPVPEEQILQYQDDFQRREKKLKGTRKNQPQDPGFWALPTHISKPKPVFYHTDGARISFGMSRFLRLQCIYTPEDLLPQVHSQDKGTTYPSAIFGTVYKRLSIGSRVSIEDCPAVGDPVSSFANLLFSRPNPAFSPVYLQDEKTYNHHDASLRGYKHYWLKDPVPYDKSSKFQFESMPTGTRFSGVIRYHHMTPDELGLLLWCITLEEGCFHSIGRGKPFGYGRIRIQIDDLFEYDPEKLYRSLTATPTPCSQLPQRIRELIKCYQEKAQTLLEAPEKSLLDYPHIQDFLYMKRTIRTDTEQVSYMKIVSGYNEYEHANRPLPTVRQIREEAAAL